MPPHHLVQKDQLEALDRQVQAQSRYLAALMLEASNSVQAMHGVQEEIGLLRLEVRELADRPPPPVAPPAAAPTPSPPAQEPLRSRSPEVVFEGKKVVGAVEKVYLAPPNILLPARIDTGAATSSLDARDLRDFERDGAPWVRFHIVDPETGDEVEVERKVVRHVRIISAAAEESERRPVIELHVILGGISRTAQFTLSDRSSLEFPLLIGRNILQDLILVDVGREYIAPPQVPDSKSP
ncbi:ATP-dependent zinc protease family protein [Geoalkalibacter halelectricus]|uniref:ATP-dependent zinc protease n=1 Tax=Geoalkalibacter halelectricus TaxID=2847045 RepID=A0ABY5ZN16_9BACT|nr:ATP-dependent zinc protease [Geoalkalibacter halelectricus]UWZ80126.1 ATP-dependent zinc protease [Geoalkalibacter halelectricus]